MATTGEYSIGAGGAAAKVACITGCYAARLAANVVAALGTIVCALVGCTLQWSSRYCVPAELTREGALLGTKDDRNAESNPPLLNAVIWIGAAGFLAILAFSAALDPSIRLLHLFLALMYALVSDSV